MTEKKMFANQCGKCGAPLIQRENELFCDYCKTSFKLPLGFVDYFKSNEQKEENNNLSNNPVTVSQQPTIISSQLQTQVRKTPVGLILLAIAGIFIFLWFSIIGSGKKDISSKKDPNQQTEMQMFRMNSSAMPDEYPADFIHSEPLSIGVMLDNISYSEFSISIYAKNELDRTNYANLKTDQMIISTVDIEDSLGNQYSCEVNNEFTGSYDEMDPEGIAKIGELNCIPGLIPPDVKYIGLKVAFTNWGNYDFQIPIDLNIQEIRIEYNLNRHDDSFDIEPVFYATIPQYIVINYKDISVIDDNGNYYPLEYCDDYSTIGRESDKYIFFIDLAERYDPGSFFYCHFNSPIPYEVNAITFVMNIRGNTITHVFTTDTVQQ